MFKVHVSRAALVLWSTIAASLVPAGAEVRPDRIEEQYRDWTVTCLGDADALSQGCSLQQVVTDENSNAVLMRFVVEPGRNGDAPLATIIAPFGLDLSKALKLSVDGTAQRDLAFKTCLQVGCLAPLPLDEPTATALRGATSLEVTMWPSDDPSGALVLPVSLEGFGDALDRLKALASPASP